MQRRMEEARKEGEEALRVGRELDQKNPENHLTSQLMLSALQPRYLLCPTAQWVWSLELACFSPEKAFWKPSEIQPSK
jgi:hypothetical protein